MKREDATVIQYEQPIKIEKPLQCFHCSCIIASFVKEIMLPLLKLNSWLKKQQPIWKSQSPKLEDEDLQKLEKLLM